MDEILKQPTMEKRLEAYRNSKLFDWDVSWLKNEYTAHLKLPAPSDQEAEEKVMAEMKTWLEQYALCEAEGHLLYEDNVDGENGRNDLSCDRCGFSQTIQW